MNKLVALCLGGCESEVQADILSKLIALDPAAYVEILPGSSMEFNRMSIEGCFGNSSGKNVFKGEAGCGKLLVTTSADCCSLLSSIRSVQYWMVYLTHGVDAMGSLKDLSTLTSLLREKHKINWKHSYNTWRSCLGYYESTFANSRSSSSDAARRDRYLALRSNITHLPRFCARCIRDGEHSYNSLEVARTIGDWTAGATGWSVDLTRMDVEVVCFIMNETFVVGLSIPSENSFFTRSRLPSENRAPVVSADDTDNKVRALGVHNSLRPSTAHMLLKLSKPIVGDVVVDALCGTGACMTEAAYSFGCIALAGDADPCSQSALQKGMYLTSNMSKNTAITEGLLWGANMLPLRTNTIDIVIVDLPFGKPSSVLPKRFRAKMSRFVAQTLRVLREGIGRCVFLTQSHQQLSVCLDSVYVSTKNVRLVNFGGYVSTLVYAERSSVPFREEVVIQQSDGTAGAGTGARAGYNCFAMPIVRNTAPSTIAAITKTATSTACSRSKSDSNSDKSSAAEDETPTAVLDDSAAAAVTAPNMMEYKKRKIEVYSENPQLEEQA